MTPQLPNPQTLPAGWTTRVPGPDDVDALVELARANQEAVRGMAMTRPRRLRSAVVGQASWTRRQAVVVAEDGRIAAWCLIHDRAAGRTDVTLVVAPEKVDGGAPVAPAPDPAAREMARALLAWAREVGTELARQRLRAATRLDVSVYVEDERLKGWLAEAGYGRARTWLHMTRAVDDAETLPGPRDGVTVRPVGVHAEGMPVAADLQIVHLMLEESFVDHFNSYRESFPEFVQRLREDPGHRWDHWWIAEIERDGDAVPGGALVSSVSPSDESGAEGTYIDYIGVHRTARGHGVAKALLATVIRDARARGRNRVGLEVDADSPTGADGLYRSMGWMTKYRTETWHADVAV